MGRGRKAPAPSVDVRIDRLEERHASGADDEGRRWLVRGAPVGAVVRAQPGRKGTARRMEVVEPACDAVAPACPVFSLCGGCQLQEMPLERQRAEKRDLVARLVGGGGDVVVHPTRGAEGAYAYRNKLELSFGARRFLPDDLVGTGLSVEGTFLGFHPPGWFSRIVAVHGCPLGSAAMNRVIERVVALAPGPPWHNQRHEGAWRHVVVRDSGTPEEPRVVVALVTSSSADPHEVRRVGAEVAALPGVVGVVWVVTDALAEVASGELREVLAGSPTLRFDLAGVLLELPHDAFFQVNTVGAGVLFRTVAEALAGGSGTLLDLYCGSGAIGLVLGGGFEWVVGIEVHEGAVLGARDNAARNGISGEWCVGQVEDVLPELEVERPLQVVVDPPRAGLHPKAAAFLAELPADALAYVACNPASLGRDRAILEAGGWRLTDLWPVDLFPQTHHVEAVARFLRQKR